MSWQKILTIDGSSPGPTRQPIQYHLMSSGARHHTGEWLRRPTVPTCSPLHKNGRYDEFLDADSEAYNQPGEVFTKKKEIDTLSQEGYFVCSITTILYNA